MLLLKIYSKTETITVNLEKEKGLWFMAMLEKLTPNNPLLSFSQLKADFETQFEDFEIFWYSKSINVLRNNGLLVL